MKKTLIRFLPYLRDYKISYIFVLFGIILTIGATLATAQIMQPLMDNMFIERDKTMLYKIPIGIIIIYVLKALGRYIQTIFMEYIGTHILARLRETVLDKILNLDMQFLHENRSGELLSRLTNDIGRIEYFVSRMLPEFLREILTIVGIVGYVIYLNPMLSFYALVVLPFTIYPLILIAKRLKRISRKAQSKNADVVTRLTEVFNNSEVIKANATETFELRRFSDDNWKFFKLNMKNVYTSNVVSPLMEIIGALGIAAVIFMGGSEVYDGNMTVGEFTAFLTAVGLVFQPIRRVSSIYSKVQDAIVATERVFYILTLDTRIKDGENILKEDIQFIEFSDVELKYEDSVALSNINLSIKAGENIALVGDSGGGKSSLINLLLRFYDTSSGTITINGTNITSFEQKSLRHHISLVSQRVYIFQDSLAANVAYGENEIDEVRVHESLALADAQEFVNNLDEGIHTLLQEAGANLSGGQRQRIAIARAIYKHASLLLFDEATSALDNKSEKRIQDAIDTYAKDKITITIAHRLSTVQHADLILVFKQGKIVARGTHTELLENSSEYQRLSGVLS